MNSKWIKVIKTNTLPLVLILEKFDKNIHIELFSIITEYLGDEPPKSKFYLEGAFYDIKFDFNEIYSHVKELIKKHYYTDNDEELKEFIVTFIGIKKLEENNI